MLLDSVEMMVGKQLGRFWGSLMNRIGQIVFAAMLVAPVAAQAQKPSATLQTRSAELYLASAAKTQHPDERAKFLKKALDVSLEGIQKDPGNPKTWFTLGEVYVLQMDPVGADSAFDKAESIYPAYTKDTEAERLRLYVSTFNAGVTALQQNNTAEAIKNLEAADMIYGKKPTAMLNLGNLYAKSNNLDKAAAAYRRSLEIMRGPERKGLSPADEKQWAAWEEAASFNLAQILAIADKNEEAAAAYVDFIARNPSNVTAKSNLAVVYTRMGKTAEAQKVYQDLLSQDLNDEDYFAVGVGLFRANQYDAAVNAFRKSIAKNPALRDAYYNLAQAIYSQVSALEDERGKAKIAEQKAFDVKLKPMYEELQAAAEKAREFDPNNRNVLALLARAYRGMADVVDPKAAMEWKNKTLAVMTAHQDMPFEIVDVSVTNENGEATLKGNLVNLKGTAGAPVKLVVSFLGKDGAVLGTQEVTVTAPKTEEQVEFKASLKTATVPGGWKYEVAK